MANNICKVSLLKPKGINNFPGTSFRCFTCGEALPFYIEFSCANGDKCDITDWECYIAFSSTISCDAVCEDPPDVLLKVIFDHYDSINGVFAGTVSGEQTSKLPCGLLYATINYIIPRDKFGAPPTDGADVAAILDMCQLEVYPGVDPVA